MSRSNDVRQHASPSAFGSLVKRLRQSADLTQEELAERSGVSARLVSDLERGVVQRPRRDTVQLLADGLRIHGAERDTFTAIARRRTERAGVGTGEPPAEPTIRLPTPPTGLIGRAREVSETAELIRQPDVRLVTVIGPGGVGKTRLALEVAAHVAQDFSNGVFFIDLAPVSNPAQLGPTLAHALGLRFTSDASIVDQLTDAARDLKLLVLLDNVEHLVSIAPDVGRLLASCPDLTVLATSRQPLQLRVERAFPLPPLSLPDTKQLPPIEELRTIPAVELFVRRAEALDPAFALTPDNARDIAEIVVRLDGLPLAIELAIPRLKVLSPAELHDRLGRRLPLLTTGAVDLPERQQTLRATIEWSYELLDEETRQVFRLLTVFVGGFTLTAAEVIAASPLRQSVDVLEALTTLTNQSLLARHDNLTTSNANDSASRFRMLETIREFGLERLADAGEAAHARKRHADWCVHLAEQAEPKLTGASQRLWFAILESEHDNLRAALGWAIQQRDAQTALRMCGSLARFWYTEGFYAEGRRWMELALELPDDTPSPWRAKALLGAGVIAQLTGDYERAEAYPTLALADYRALSDKHGIASSYGNLGVVADAQQNYALAGERYEHALAYFRELGDQSHASFMLGNLGLIAYLQGEYERASELMGESLALCRARDDRNSIAITLGNLGLVAFALGDYEQAEAYQQEALALRRELSNRANLTRVLENFALIAAARREPVRAARLFGAAAALRSEIGTALPPNDREYNDRFIDIARSALGEPAFAAQWERGATMTLEEAIDYAARLGSRR